MICEDVSVPAGTVMYCEGDKADKLFILVEGEVDIQYALGSGELRTVDTVVPGDLLMWSALVEPYKSTAVVAVRQNSRLIAVDAEKLHRVLRDGPEIGQRGAPASDQNAGQPIGGCADPIGHQRLSQARGTIPAGEWPIRPWPGP